MWYKIFLIIGFFLFIAFLISLIIPTVLPSRISTDFGQQIITVSSVIPSTGFIPTLTPQQGAENVPQLILYKVIANKEVTFIGFNFPSNHNILCRIGLYGTKGIDGIPTTSFNTGVLMSYNNGFSESYQTITIVMQIPEMFANINKLAVRCDSDDGYYAYSWFENKDNNYIPSLSTSGYGGKDQNETSSFGSYSAIININYPKMMKIGKSDFVRLSLSLSDDPNRVVTAVPKNRIVIKEVPFTLPTLSAYTSSFETTVNEELCVTANLQGSSFTILNVIDDCLPLNKKELVWEWNLLSAETNLPNSVQTLSTNIDLKFRSKGNGSPQFLDSLWERKIEVNVVKPLSIYANLPSIITLVGSLITLLTAYFVFKMEKEKRINKIKIIR